MPSTRVQTLQLLGFLLWLFFFPLMLEGNLLHRNKTKKAREHSFPSYKRQACGQKNSTESTYINLRGFCVVFGYVLVHYCVIVPVKNQHLRVNETLLSQAHPIIERSAESSVTWMWYIGILGKQFQGKYWLQTNLHNNLQKNKLFRKQVRVSNQNLLQNVSIAIILEWMVDHGAIPCEVFFYSML